MWQLRRKRPGDAVRLDGAQAASALALHLQHGGDLSPVEAPGLPLADGEVAVADVMCSAARYYGTDVVYPRSAGYFEDHPAFGRRWVPNHRLDARRYREAEAAAEPQWRDHAQARVVLTSAGVRLGPSGSGSSAWLPFDHSLLSGVTAGHDNVVLTYTVCAPLLLAGPAAPWLGVAIEHVRRAGP
ncbi:hypothetical protein ACWC9Q_10610 [Streptomyces sp. NPDC001142]